MMPIQILVISLKHSHDRQARVTYEMAKTKLEWRFLEAVDGSKLDWLTTPYLSHKVKRLLGFELTPKEIGCYLSHLKAWQTCVEKNVPTLVLEDDFIVDPNLELVLSHLLSDSLDWDIVRLQALCDSSDVLIADFDRSRLVKNNSDPLGATAYLVNPLSAKQLLTYSSEIYEPLDHFIEHYEKHGLKMFAVKPYPITVADPTRATSTITDRPDRQPLRGWRKIIRSAARLMDRLFSNN